MLFNSWQFLGVFLPIALLAHWLVVRFQPSLRLPFLLLLSLSFYSYWDPRFLPLIVASIGINWLVARSFWRTRHAATIVAAIVANIAVLGVFKYTGFFTRLMSPIVELPTAAIADLALPLGISFFTFHHVMYLADLRTGVAPRFGLVKYGLYIAFFPQVLAGPLVRWSEIMHQFDESPYQRPDALERFARGLLLLIMGLAKKILLGDPLASLADPIFKASTGVAHVPFMDAWQATLAFTFQIYFDFSGYTDMALGIALMFGIVLPQNFNSPYRAMSLQDFWRRWHMTLSRFLRDYLYIPLGGSRRGLHVQILALLATMTLGGLWHGAGVNFIIWGALHGVGLCVVLLWSRISRPLPSPIAWALTFAFVVVLWVPFRAPDFDSAMRIWGGLTEIQQFDHRLASPAQWSLIGIAFVVSVAGPTAWTLAQNMRLSFGTSLAAGTLGALVLLGLSGVGSQQFIYFQF